MRSSAAGRYCASRRCSEILPPKFVCSSHMITMRSYRCRGDLSLISAAADFPLSSSLRRSTLDGSGWNIWSLLPARTFASVTAPLAGAVQCSREYTGPNASPKYEAVWCIFHRLLPGTVHWKLHAGQPRRPRTLLCFIICFLFIFPCADDLNFINDFHVQQDPEKTWNEAKWTWNYVQCMWR